MSQAEILCAYTTAPVIILIIAFIGAYLGECCVYNEQRWITQSDVGSAAPLCLSPRAPLQLVHFFMFKNEKELFIGQHITSFMGGVKNV